MKNDLLKKSVPHFIAVVVFLATALFFCKPVLDGNVLSQHDILSWKGMAQNSFEYKEAHGHFPLWNPNLFSGMPNYQVAMEGKSVLPDLVKVFTLGMPKPINFFFLACICFYILCLVLRTRPIIAMLGALAFAFSTYNPVIISAGHESKMLAIALMPLLMAGLISTYEKRYWLGLALTTIGTYLEVGVNHPQISFYFFLIAVAVTLCYLYVWIRQKDWLHIGKAAAITFVAGLIGLAGSAPTLLTTSEYTKFTMRGGKDISIDGDKVKAAKTSGLDTAYAFEYSLGKSETAVILMPDAFGSSSAEVVGENSSIVDKLVNRGAPQSNAIQIANSIPKYWGGIDGAAGTAGPPYVGAVICLLALVGFVIYKNPLRWGLLAVTVLGILMAWGKYLPGFNTFLFNNLPLYNKFRAPTMAMVITQFTLPVMAVLGLQYLLYRDKSKELLKADFKKILYAVGGLFALLLLLYIGMDYSSPFDRQIIGNKWDNSGTDEIGRLIVSGLKADRKAMFGGQLLRTFGFAVLVLGLLYLYLRNVIKPLVVVIVLLIVSTIDLLVIDKSYLREENYSSPDELTSRNFSPDAVDRQLQADKDPHFRVFNLTANPYTESRTSYFHRSIGGYHPAKLRTYQDVIDRYLSGPFNDTILNMLDAKYIVTRDPQSRQTFLVPRPNPYGPCWLVKYVKIVEDRVQEIQSIGNTHLKDTAIVEKSFAKNVIQPQADSGSFINLVKYDNDAIDYKAHCNGPQFAVFSEIYYPKGWNAYIDGKKAEYCKTNYILRGLSIPAGDHTIRFVFEPSSYKKGITIGFIASILILLFFLGGLYMAWRQPRSAGKQPVAV